MTTQCVVIEQARTVVAENLPENPSIETIEPLFRKVGTVKMVRICSPEAANGANSTAAKHPKTDMLISNKVNRNCGSDNVFTVVLLFKGCTRCCHRYVKVSNTLNWRQHFCDCGCDSVLPNAFAV